MNYQTFLDYMIRYRSRLESKGVHEIQAKGIIMNHDDYMELTLDDEFVNTPSYPIFWDMEFHTNKTIPLGKIILLSILDEAMADEQDRNEAMRERPVWIDESSYFTQPSSGITPANGSLNITWASANN